MQSHTFTCTGNQVMYVTHVLWGRLPPSPASLCNPFNTNVTGANCQGGATATLYVENLCNGKPSCVVQNDWQQLGQDPCTGVPKYLQVSYMCIIPTTSSKTTAPVSTTPQIKVLLDIRELENSNWNVYTHTGSHPHTYMYQ